MTTSTQMPTGLRILATLASLIVVATGIWAARPILVPVLFAAFLAIISGPAMTWLIQRRVPRPAALLMVVLGMAAIVITVVVVIGQSLYSFRDNLETYKEPLQQKVAAITDRLTEAGIQVSESARADNFNTDNAVDYLKTLLGGLTNLFGKGLFVLFSFVFIVLEAAGFPAKVAAMPGDTTARLDRWHRIITETRRYFALKTVISLVTGVAIGVMLAVLKVPYAPLWALMAFLFNFIPNIGSIIAAVPPIVITFIVLDGSTLIWVIAIYLAVNLLIGNMIEPRIMGRGLGLSTLVVFLSLVFWGFVLGPVGMLLSVPLTMIAKIVLTASDDTRWLGLLLSDEVAEPA
jgi:AI-2 transport protein TqsA